MNADFEKKIPKLTNTHTNQIIEIAIQAQAKLFVELENTLREQIKILSEENKELVIQNRDLSNRLQNRNQIIENAEQMNIHHQIVKKREIKIEKYSEALRNCQTGVKSLMQGLESDLLMAVNLNPASNLLKMTEFELEKTEIELKKTPTSSTDRKMKEQIFDELIQQRNFLRSVIQSSQSELKAKIQILKEAMNDPVLQDLPPMPPLVLERR